MIKCYVLAIGGLPHPLFQRRQAKAVADFLKGLDGFIGIHLLDRYRTMLAFKTLNDAKTARNLLRAEGNSTGNYIMNAEITDDMQTLTVTTPAEEVLPEDRRRIEESIERRKKGKQ